MEIIKKDHYHSHLIIPIKLIWLIRLKNVNLECKITLKFKELNLPLLKEINHQLLSLQILSKLKNNNDKPKFIKIKKKINLLKKTAISKKIIVLFIFTRIK
jgi:hypothetical protein